MRKFLGRPWKKWRSLLWPQNSKTLFYIPGFIFVPPHDPTVGSVSFNMLSFLFEVSSNKFWTELPFLSRCLAISLQCPLPLHPNREQLLPNCGGAQQI